MGIGVYGITRPSDVKIEDIEIFYNYVPNRNTSNNNFIKLNSSVLLEYCYLNSDNNNNENLIEGVYNLKLPTSIFNQLGIYTVYIKPKTIQTTIVDCNVLLTLPNIKGIVVDMYTLPEELRKNNALQGYRVEYIDFNGKKIRNLVRYIVSSNKVSITTDNISNNTQKSQKYRFDDLGNLIFLQLTPSSSSDVKPNIIPYIGTIGQKILLSNTYFTPIVLEIELVENTIDTIANLIAGEQIKDVQKGILTYYDNNRKIVKQFDLYEIKDDVTDVPLYEVKEKRNTIDISQEFDNIIGDLK